MPLETTTKRCLEVHPTLQAGLYTIHGSLQTDLGEDAVLGVLTDYDGLSRIYNNIEDSQVLSSGSQKQVLQVCDLHYCAWQLLLVAPPLLT